MAETLETYRGDCLPLITELVDADNHPFDLTGYGAEIRVVWPGCKSEIVIDDPTIDIGAAKISGDLTGDQTKQLPLGKHTDVKLVLIEPDGCKKTLLIAEIRVKP